MRAASVDSGVISRAPTPSHPFRDGRIRNSVRDLARLCVRIALTEYAVRYQQRAHQRPCGRPKHNGDQRSELRPPGYVAAHLEYLNLTRTSASMRQANEHSAWLT